MEEKKVITQQKAIIDDSFVRARPWPCCKDPFLVRRTEELIPVIALCDKKAGHGGVHRGRMENRTYLWRTLSKGETAARRAQQQAEINRTEKKLNEEKEDERGK